LPHPQTAVSSRTLGRLSAHSKESGLCREGFTKKRKLWGNWVKAKRKLAKEYEHVGNFRRDLFFKLGALLEREYDLLVLKDLNVEGLIQKDETKKRRLLPHDCAFFELRRILE